MAYIGNSAANQTFTPIIDTFNGNGSTTAFTLTYPVASVAQVEAYISNVPQQPGVAYTVLGNTITFTSAPPSGTANIYVRYTSPITQIMQPGAGTVGLPQLATNIQDALFGNFRNRIINGAMMIDQRNAGASVTVNSAAAFYAVDRFRMSGTASAGVFTGQQVSDAPSGFVNSLKITTTTADSSLAATDEYLITQPVEGLNIADFAWGTSAASPVALSFWVKSSLTGTFGGSFSNASVNRSYPFTYTINSANTWEQKTVLVAGDTTGTWLTTNGTGIRLYFGLGQGSNFSGTAGAWASAQYESATGVTAVIGTLNATWQITGVQLEKGSTATSFDYRPYGTELALCQRYYWKGTVNAGGVFGGSGGSIPIVAWGFPVTMRSAPTFSWISGGSTSNGNADYTITGVTGYSATVDSLRILWTQTGSTGANAQGAMTTGALCSNSSEL